MKNHIQVSRGHAKFLAGLRRALAPAVAKNECLSLIRRQQLQLARQRCCELRTAGAVDRIERIARLGAMYVARFIIVSVFENESAVKMKANLIHHLVMQDSVQPCLNPGRVVEPRPALQSDKQRLGHGVLRPLDVAQTCTGGAKQASTAGHDSFKKCIRRLVTQLSLPVKFPAPLPGPHVEPTR